MAEALTIFFVAQFVLFFGCFFMKLYSVMSSDDPSPIRDSVMVLLIGLFVYGVGLFAVLTDYSSFTYIVMFRLQSLFVVFFFILFIIELFIFYKSLYRYAEGYRSNSR